MKTRKQKEYIYKDGRSAVEELRLLVQNFDRNRESTTDGMSIEQVLLLHFVWQLSDWDIWPDQWSSRQIRKAFEGEIPQFHTKTERPVQGTFLTDAEIERKGLEPSIFRSLVKTVKRQRERLARGQVRVNVALVVKGKPSDVFGAVDAALDNDNCLQDQINSDPDRKVHVVSALVE